MKLKIHSYAVVDLDYRLDTTKKLLKQVWKGPLVVEEVMFAVLFKIVARKKSYILHYDRLKPCEDRYTMLWLRCKRNSLLSKADSIEIKDIVFDDDSMNLDLLFEKSDVLHEKSMIWLKLLMKSVSHDNSFENIVDSRGSQDVSQA